MPVFKVTAFLSLILTLLCSLLIVWGRDSAPTATPMFAFSTYDNQGIQPDIHLADLRLKVIYNLTQNELDDFEPLWSPDGTRLAFTSRTNANHLYVMTLPAGEIVAMPRFVGFYDPVWSADGEAILVTKQEYDASAAYASDAQEIVYRLQSNGDVTRIGQEEPIAAAHLARSGDTHISPDSRYIVLVNGPGMAVMDTQNNEVIWQTDLTLPFDRPAWRP